MSLELRLQRAFNKEAPATAMAKILPPTHPLFDGLSLALRFEKHMLDLPVSAVPPLRMAKYNAYLRKVEDYLHPQNENQL